MTPSSRSALIEAAVEEQTEHAIRQRGEVGPAQGRVLRELSQGDGEDVNHATQFNELEIDLN